MIASNIGKYVQSTARPYLAQGLSLAGQSAENAQIQASVTAFQTSLEQMAATIGLFVLKVILAIAFLIVGIGSLPLTVSAVEIVLQGREGNGG